MRGPASRRNRQSDAYDFPEGFIDQPIPESSRNHSIPIRYISVTPIQSDRQSPSIAGSTVPELSRKGRVGAARRTSQRSTAFLETRRIVRQIGIPAQDSPLLGYATRSNQLLVNSRTSPPYQTLKSTSTLHCLTTKKIFR